MKVEGTDKFSGRPWWVESDIEIEVQVCPQCGNPIAIINTSETQQVEKVRFQKAGYDSRLITIGEFNVQVIKEHLLNLPEPCPWCGFVPE